MHVEMKGEIKNGKIAKEIEIKLSLKEIRGRLIEIMKEIEISRGRQVEQNITSTDTVLNPWHLTHGAFFGKSLTGKQRHYYE